MDSDNRVFCFKAFDNEKKIGFLRVNRIEGESANRIHECDNDDLKNIETFKITRSGNDVIIIPICFVGK